MEWNNYIFEPYIYLPTWFHDSYGQGWNSITLYHRETLKSPIVSCCIAQKTNLSLQNQSVQLKPWITSKTVWRGMIFFSAWWNTWHGLPEGIIYDKGSRRKSETLVTTKGTRGGVCVEKQTLKWPFNQQVNTHHDTKAVMYWNSVVMAELKDYCAMTRKLIDTNCIFYTVTTSVCLQYKWIGYPVIVLQIKSWDYPYTLMKILEIILPRVFLLIKCIFQRKSLTLCCDFHRMF